VLLFWLVFGSGVLVHLLAPNLERKQEGFVIPVALSVGEGTVAPALIVAKERRMQVISAVLTASGALGLGFLYRGVLWPRATAGGPNRSGDGRSGSLLGEKGGWHSEPCRHIQNSITHNKKD